MVRKTNRERLLIIKQLIEEAMTDSIIAIRENKRLAEEGLNELKRLNITNENKDNYQENIFQNLKLNYLLLLEIREQVKFIILAEDEVKEIDKKLRRLVK